MQRTLGPSEISRILGVAPKTPYDIRWRRRVGLPARRVGRKLRFVEADVWKLLDDGLEQLLNEELGDNR